MKILITCVTLIFFFGLKSSNAQNNELKPQIQKEDSVEIKYANDTKPVEKNKDSGTVEVIIRNMNFDVGQCINVNNHEILVLIKEEINIIVARESNVQISIEANFKTKELE